MELSTSTVPQVVYDGAVTRVDLDVWHSDLEELLTRMGPVFYRTESRRHADQYLRGLLAPIERKNGWTIAEYVGESEPKALQRFLNLSPWDVDLLLELNRDYILENFASPEAILVADPTGFAKKGTKSVGVQRQYSGTLGRIVAIHLGASGWSRPTRGPQHRYSDRLNVFGMSQHPKVRSMRVWRRVGRVPASPRSKVPGYSRGYVGVSK
jgi:hypothetical protein